MKRQHRRDAGVQEAQEAQEAPEPRRAPSPGWLWRCIDDRELLIEDAIGKQHQVCFDTLGLELVKQLKSVRLGSPRSRSEKFSVFKEITSEQLKDYAPGQILTMISQRERVRNLAQAASSAVHSPPGFHFSQSTGPWVPNWAEECRFACCQSCRPSCELRSYMSINSIVDGDIPPTAAIGFGFESCSFRPIIHPDRLKNIGLRAVPWPLAHGNPGSSVGSWRSSWNNSWENLSLADDQKNKTEHAEHVEDVEDVKYAERAESIQSQSLEIGLTTERTTSVKFTNPSVNGVNGVNGANSTTLSPRSVTHDSFEENFKSAVSIGYSISHLPLTQEEQACLRKRPSKLMEEEGDGSSGVDHGVKVPEKGVGVELSDIITQL
ncbi:hypothetical protein F4814DRAFT_449199 [Daldinia grandis]|nr:hypothetical protein F4814DRAFT_449199 [Daldinia grandis]